MISCIQDKMDSERIGWGVAYLASLAFVLASMAGSVWGVLNSLGWLSPSGIGAIMSLILNGLIVGKLYGSALTSLKNTQELELRRNGDLEALEREHRKSGSKTFP